MLICLRPFVFFILARIHTLKSSNVQAFGCSNRKEYRKYLIDNECRLDNVRPGRFLTDL